MTRNHFISSARLISVLTMVSRALGFIRDMVCANFFGTAIWHYFMMGFMVPNLFRRLFGEGALSAALIPVYTEKLVEDERAAQALARSVVTLLVMILALLTLAGLFLIFILWHLSARTDKNLLMLTLAAIMLPYMILICLVATVGGLLNVHKHFGAPAAAPIVLNICIIIAIVCLREKFGSDPWRQIYVVAWAVLGAGFLQLLLQVPALWRLGIDLRPRFVFWEESVNRIGRLMAPMLIGLSAMQLNTYLDYLIAHFLSATPESGSHFVWWGQTIAYPVIEGSVSYLYFAQRLYQLPLGVFGIALATAIFPLFSRYAAEKKVEDFSETLRQGIRMVIFISIPATVGLILIRQPLVQCLFERGEFTSKDTAGVSWTLLFYAIGLGAYFMQHLAVRAFYAFQDSVTPVKVAVRIIGLNLMLNLVLIWPLGTGGLALSTALCAILQVSILLRILFRRYNLHFSDGFKTTLVKTLGATGLMMAAGVLIMIVCADMAVWVQLLAAVAGCMAVFAGVSAVLQMDELRAVFGKK